MMPTENLEEKRSFGLMAGGGSLVLQLWRYALANSAYVTSGVFRNIMSIQHFRLT